MVRRQSAQSKYHSERVLLQARNKNRQHEKAASILVPDFVDRDAARTEPEQIALLHRLPCGESSLLSAIQLYLMCKERKQRLLGLGTSRQADPRDLHGTFQSYCRDLLPRQR